MSDSITFSKNLIKGRIAELLFEQMLRDTEKFTILSFGYENIIPELAHRQNDLHAAETLEIIRRSPDFAVIDNETHEVHLVEVKYLMNPNENIVLKYATTMLESWKPSYLFLATPDKFYFDKAKDIVENRGKMNELDLKIPIEVKNKYIALLNEFISPK